MHLNIIKTRSCSEFTDAALKAIFRLSVCAIMNFFKPVAHLVFIIPSFLCADSILGLFFHMLTFLKEASKPAANLSKLLPHSFYTCSTLSLVSLTFSSGTQPYCMSLGE